MRVEIKVRDEPFVRKYAGVTEVELEGIRVSFNHEQFQLVAGASFHLETVETFYVLEDE